MQKIAINFYEYVRSVFQLHWMPSIFCLMTSSIFLACSGEIINLKYF